MKNWEEVFKESLEDYSSSLPEGSLEGFQGKLSSHSRSLSMKWVWWAVPAAACVAMVAVLLYDHRIEESVTGVDTIAQVMEVPEPEVLSPVVPCEREAQDKIAAIPEILVEIPEKIGKIREEIEEIPEEIGEISEEVGETPEEILVVTQDADPEECMVKHEMAPKALDKINVSIPTTGGVIGGVVAGLLVSSRPSELDNSGYMSPSSLIGLGDLSSLANGKLVEYKHFMPVKLGLELRIPLSDRLYVTTGGEYSLYRSSVERFVTGTEMQNVHYLGVPLRLDWSFLKRERVELYTGAGSCVDFCIAASHGDSSVKKDGAIFSVVTVGGALLKLNQHLGLYLEPQLSWTPSSSCMHLETYRTNDPLMFTISSGIRFTL
ncbi:MAG: hypothetical protein MJZ09_08420 [Bacteroidales bacterium]|nr:hypothetical protein [Bacteroidales bacterium]